MNKYLIIQDINTKQYFTDIWGKYWSKDVSDSKLFTLDNNIESEISLMYNANDDIFLGIENIQIIEIYSKR